MSEQTFSFLSEYPPFAALPETERRSLAAALSIERFAAGTLLATRGKTPIERVLIVQSGKLQLFAERDGHEVLRGTITRGESFGGVSLLMNAGLAVRSVRADETCACYVLPAGIFSDLCRRHQPVAAFFVDLFTKRMLDDSYASLIAEGQTAHFLSGIVPFSFLPEEAMLPLARELSLVFYPKNTVLFLQDRSRVEYLYIVQKGAAERYYEEGERITLLNVLGEGDLYGGISMLLNDGVAIRTLRTREDTWFYILPRQRFLALCHEHESFSEYFTDTFGRRMLDKSYAAIIGRRIQPRGDTPQFFNQPVSHFFSQDLVSCDAGLSIQQAAAVMTRHRCSSIFVKDDTGRCLGVVTDNDLRSKVIAPGLDTHHPVSAIMSAPLATIPKQAMAFEALLMMMQHNIKHLAVSDSDGRVVGVVTNHDLLTAQGQSPLFLIREIKTAANREGLNAIHERLPGLIHSLITGGAKAADVNRLITTISDAILQRLIGFALEACGPPPVPFTFMIMGSEGRREQTLKTDQDNAIVYADVPPEMAETAERYFLGLAEKICTWLNDAGYSFCKGNVMAKNPLWCKPLKAWKQIFWDWIRSAEAEDLLHASIFFDFRAVEDDAGLVHALRVFLNDTLQGWSGFFRHLTENALSFKPPLGFFRNFVVESRGEHRNAFDIKSAMLPIVDFARIYALKEGIAETNTLERLKQLHLKKIFTWEEYNELEKAYGFMMQLRFMRQVTVLLEDNAPPDNYITPQRLSRIEQTMLKEIFRRIEKFQVKLSFAFTGSA